MGWLNPAISVGFQLVASSDFFGPVTTTLIAPFLNWCRVAFCLYVRALRQIENVFLSMDDIHKMLGHPSEEITKATADKLMIKTADKINKCENCDIGKMKRKNIKKKKLD